MFKLTLKLVTILVASLATFAAQAQDSGALIEALVRKGILNDQEAEDIRADLVRDASMPPAVGTAGSSFTTRLRISGRLQPQFAGLDTSIANAADPAATNHFFLRRVYLTARADLGADWNTNITYDFAGGFFDAAWLQWKKGVHTVDIGLRKVNLGYEERTSSGSLKAIERSGVTRYFVEENNGRRLGAGSYRVGVFADGRQGKFFYGAAVTNPERAITAAAAGAAGTAGTNDLAYWGNAGFNGTMADGGTYLFGAGVGMLPDQGGKASAAPFGVGTGNDLLVYTFYFDVTKGKFNLAAEYMGADVERGVSSTRDASPFGYWIQPAFMVNDKLELVGRYSFLDSDGRGVNVSDGVRSAPSGGTMDKLVEMYFGLTYYIKGNDLKFQLGYVYGKSKDTVTGGAAEAEANGLRSQMQLNF